MSDQARLGVLEDWKAGPHLLTYRQTERIFSLAAAALASDGPGGRPPDRLQRLCDALLEASIPERFKDASRSLAVGLDGRGVLLPRPPVAATAPTRGALPAARKRLEPGQSRQRRLGPG
ncbi:MAG: hypothetical protein WBF34_30440 [Streptosporangiaceae bacterium]